MVFLIFISTGKLKKILLPAISVKDIKPIALLLKPSNLVIPMLLVSLLSQLSDNLRSTLSYQSIQNLDSIKFYKKTLLFGFNNISLTVIQAISKTLGPELESLSILDVSERLLFLKALQLKVILDKGSYKTDFKNRNHSNPVELMKYRKGLAVQSRSSMVYNSIFSFNSIVFGLPVSAISLDLVLQSSKLMWLSLGLLDEDFDFLIRKDAINSLKTCNLSSIFDFPSSNIEALKIIFFKEIRDLTFVDSPIDFSNDNIILKGEDNLVLLEKQLGFIKRNLPIIPNDLFFPENDLDDVLLRVALDQRRKYKANFENIYNLSRKIGNKKKQDLLKEVKLKRFLDEN